VPTNIGCPDNGGKTGLNYMDVDPFTQTAREETSAGLYRAGVTAKPHVSLAVSASLLFSVIAFSWSLLSAKTGGCQGRIGGWISGEVVYFVG